MLRPLTSLCLSLALAAPLAAQDLRVVKRINVSATAGGFEVDSGGGNGARGMWCAAGRYSLKKLNAKSAQRIYVDQGSSLSRGLFTLDPSGLTPQFSQIIGSSVRTPGAYITTAQALSYCADFFTAGER